MRIINGPIQDGTTGKPGSQFSGTAYSYLTMATRDGVTINSVSFTPGARTYWHHHENGQILQILAGRGLIQTADEDAPRVLDAGDTVWCPPGERHWHGAATDSFMNHTAISLGVTHWAEPVHEADYKKMPEARKE